MKNRHDFLLELIAEIDQDIATANQINIRKRWIAAEILTGKHTQFSDCFANVITAVNRIKEAMTTLW